MNKRKSAATPSGSMNNKSFGSPNGSFLETESQATAYVSATGQVKQNPFKRRQTTAPPTALNAFQKKSLTGLSNDNTGNPFDIANEHRASTGSLHSSQQSPGNMVRSSNRASQEFQPKNFISLQYDVDGEFEKCRLCRRDLRQDSSAFFCVEETEKHERFRLCVVCFYKKQYYLPNKACHELLFLLWNDLNLQWESGEYQVSKLQLLRQGHTFIKASQLTGSIFPGTFTNQSLNERQCSTCGISFPQDTNTFRWVCTDQACKGDFDICHTCFMNVKTKGAHQFSHKMICLNYSIKDKFWEVQPLLHSMEEYQFYGEFNCDCCHLSLKKEGTQTRWTCLDCKPSPDKLSSSLCEKHFIENYRVGKHQTTHLMQKFRFDNIKQEWKAILKSSQRDYINICNLCNNNLSKQGYGFFCKECYEDPNSAKVKLCRNHYLLFSAPGTHKQEHSLQMKIWDENDGQWVAVDELRPPVQQFSSLETFLQFFKSTKPSDYGTIAVRVINSILEFRFVKIKDKVYFSEDVYEEGPLQHYFRFVVNLAFQDTKFIPELAPIPSPDQTCQYCRVPSAKAAQKPALQIKWICLDFNCMNAARNSIELCISHFQQVTMPDQHDFSHSMMMLKWDTQKSEWAPTEYIVRISDMLKSSYVGCKISGCKNSISSRYHCIDCDENAIGSFDLCASHFHHKTASKISGGSWKDLHDLSHMFLKLDFNQDHWVLMETIQQDSLFFEDKYSCIVCKESVCQFGVTVAFTLPRMRLPKSLIAVAKRINYDPYYICMKHFSGFNFSKMLYMQPKGKFDLRKWNPLKKNWAIIAGHLTNPEINMVVQTLQEMMIKDKRMDTIECTLCQTEIQQQVWVCINDACRLRFGSFLVCDKHFSTGVSRNQGNQECEKHMMMCLKKESISDMIVSWVPQNVFRQNDHVTQIAQYLNPQAQMENIMKLAGHEWQSRTSQLESKGEAKSKSRKPKNGNQYDFISDDDLGQNVSLDGYSGGNLTPSQSIGSLRQ